MRFNKELHCCIFYCLSIPALSQTHMRPGGRFGTSTAPIASISMRATPPSTGLVDCFCPNSTGSAVHPTHQSIFISTSSSRAPRRFGFCPVARANKDKLGMLARLPSVLHAIHRQTTSDSDASPAEQCTTMSDACVASPRQLHQACTQGQSGEGDVLAT